MSLVPQIINLQFIVDGFISFANLFLFSYSDPRAFSAAVIFNKQYVLNVMI